VEYNMDEAAREHDLAVLVDSHMHVPAEVAVEDCYAEGWVYLVKVLQKLCGDEGQSRTAELGTPGGGAAAAVVKQCWGADGGGEPAAAADGFEGATAPPCTEAAGVAAAALARPCTEAEPPCAADGRRAFKTLRTGGAAAAASPRPLLPSLVSAPALAPPLFVGFLAAFDSSDIPRKTIAAKV
jgi:hypothetical protein